MTFSFKKREVLVPAVAIVLIALALTAATFAWFSSSRATNVTPSAHAVSESGYDLAIGTSANGPFDATCTLSSSEKTLYPVSTADLSSWWRASFQNANGITTDYSNCTASIDDCVLSGTLYLKASSAPLAVYWYPGKMSLASDSQLLACLRLGVVITSSAGTQTLIFACDDLGSTAGASSKATTAQDGVVVQGAGSWAYAADPARSISSYSMNGDGDAPSARAGAEPLVTLAANEVAAVQYFVYMEGCDANCINEAQARDLSLQLAFAAAKA